MTHFGIICPPANGHLNPMTALGRELQRRGHRVTIVGVLDAKPNALAAGLEFRAFAESESPLGMVVQSLAQLGKLKKTTLTITHAGMNTTLESLSNGVPMVAIPIANDQPGVAARIAWTGAGEFISLSRLSVPKLRAAIHRVLTQDSYKQNAVRLQEAIRRAGGVSRAADIVEQAISTGKPVLSLAN
jgi:UDP:flavonoid glycosyltransferase YjiC (YdhE family)